jgi:hypothetical protein
MRLVAEQLMNASMKWRHRCSGRGQNRMEAFGDVLNWSPDPLACDQMEANEGFIKKWAWTH